MQGEFLLGVDGGGSKAAALLADGQGRMVGRGLAGPSNYHGIGTAAASTALRAALSAALAQAEVELASVRALCLGLAGVARPADKVWLEAWLAERAPGIPAMIVNDTDLMLAGGTPDEWGVALICGTGSNVYGRDRQGRVARAGGWGYLLGDEGSGYAIGLAALQAILRAADGRAPQTQLVLRFDAVDNL